MPESMTFGRYHFQGQHENEQILQVIHCHWFNITLHLGIMLLLSFFLLGSISFIPLLFPETASLQSASFFAFIQSTLLLFMWLYGFLTWIDYYFDVWIITNERIVNIEQRGLFARHISELNFGSVQDVTTVVTGILPTVLNYGDVVVQTAGEKERFVFRMIPDPYIIKDSIMKLSKNALDDDLRKVAGTLRAHTSV